MYTFKFSINGNKTVQISEDNKHLLLAIKNVPRRESFQQITSIIYYSNFSVTQTYAQILSFQLKAYNNTPNRSDLI